MPFTIVQAPRAWWPVTWPGVAEDGSPVTNSIEMRFRILKVDAATAFLKRVFDAQAQERAEGANLPAIYAGLVLEVADNWRHVLAENGDALPWTSDNVQLLMNEGGLFTHVFQAFRELLAGGDGVREGN